VNEGFAKDHVALEHLRRDNKGRRDTIEQADRLLKAIRSAAVKAIHSTNACAAKKDEDENEDEDKDENDNDEDHDGDKDSDHDKNQNSDHDKDNGGDHKAATPSVIFAEVDPATIADKAIVMMDLTLDAAKKALAAKTARPERSRKPDEHRKGDRHGTPSPTAPATGLVIEGKVTDATTGAPIDQACVTLGPPPVCFTRTDAAGSYRIDLTALAASPGSTWELFFTKSPDYPNPVSSGKFVLNAPVVKNVALTHR